MMRKSVVAPLIAAAASGIQLEVEFLPGIYNPYEAWYEGIEKARADAEAAAIARENEAIIAEFNRIQAIKPTDE